MATRQFFVRTALVLWIGFLAPDKAPAGPYLGEWGWCWLPGRDCPRGTYCPLHYWAPELYRIRAIVHPSNLNQFPQGPAQPVTPTMESTKYRCTTVPAAPSNPYVDPASYYGRQVVPE
jgi:hypothetical protein